MPCGFLSLSNMSDQTETPSSITYASVVTRESIRIGFVLASLNDLEVLTADVAGAYLNAPCGIINISLSIQMILFLYQNILEGFSMK